MLALALDEPRELDEQVVVQGIPLLLDRRLTANLGRYMPFTIDHDERIRWKPFRIHPFEQARQPWEAATSPPDDGSI